MTENTQNTIDQAVAEGGSYEVIRKRLEEQNKKLETSIVKLNSIRESEFGKTAIEVVDRIRVRTENNCTPRDIVRINGQLLFGYNVFIGLKKETKISDVFALYSLEESDDKHEVKQEPLENSFLDQALFKKQFLELYSYYKNAHLIQLRVNDQKLLAAFQIGEKITDIRVFRWSIEDDGSIKYIDDRGERDIELPPSYDFEWLKVSRENYVQGRHPHISILDEVFVETVGGDLTIKIEDNTEDGEGIYREDVEDSNQSLDDADILFAKVGSLILLKILPYNESVWRYLVFNTRTQEVLRIDEIGHACVQLPNEHGIVFPGGYYLQSGESKVFAEDVAGLKFKRKINSPNGEDILFVFYEHNEGKFALFSYNMIRKELQSPIFGHGYSLYDDGKMVIFKSESTEPTRIHPMQVWQTPFFSDEFNDAQTTDESFLATIGNAELVQGISELYSISKLISQQKPSSQVYDDLIKNIQRVLDGYYWLESPDIGDFSEQLKSIGDTSELVLDEFEKVKSINAQSAKALIEAQTSLNQLLKEIQVSNWDTPAPFVNGLLKLKRQKGHLLSLKEYRYIDLDKIESLNHKVDEEITHLGQKTVSFLTEADSMEYYTKIVDSVHEKISTIKTVKDLKPLTEELDEMSHGLDALSEVVNGLDIEDTLQKTQILESISQKYSRINQTKAHAKLTLKELASTESVAEFGAQLAVLSQSITNGVSSADTPDACDEQLARLLVQLEELEGLFSENDTFLEQIFSKREELYETFENKKQNLLDQRQRKAQNLQSAANRVLKSIEKRTLKFTDNDQLNTYYSSDPMVFKVSEIVGQLRELDDNVKADDVEAKLKAVREQAIRSLRDKKDIFEDGGNAIKFGKHKFSVNSQTLDLTIMPRDEKLVFHLTGTEFYEQVDNQRLNDLNDFWQQTLASENKHIYRAEYLAFSLFNEALNGESGLQISQLSNLNDEELQNTVKDYASPRYQDGYEKGIHDYDASLILKQLIQSFVKSPLLMYGSTARALANYYWSKELKDSDKTKIITQALTSQKIKDSFNSLDLYKNLCQQIATRIQNYYEQQDLEFSNYQIKKSAYYLIDYVIQGRQAYDITHKAKDLVDRLMSQLDLMGELKPFNEYLDSLKGSLSEQWQFIGYWLQGVISSNDLSDRNINEAIVYILLKDLDCYDSSSISLKCTADKLLGDHQNINNRKIEFDFDEFVERLDYYQSQTLPMYKEYREIKNEIMQHQRSSMNLEAFKARPLSSFVRNKLINESYLPIIGDNLAKQMGALGQEKRSDLMGLLLLISPPGYGKTTLMEYVANRLGLNFMKINCPSLGHDVKSLDPNNAPNATAKQELEKLNLALEMSNNVMLYLDDIQHTHPEFLQKFISLCDGTRRIEGVWKGKTNTYDLRGKKFCVIMAGNPYTESGEVFKIPDMLANRADVYNLGDVLSGQQDIFSMSYIENSLTSNSVLAPLALRDLSDLYLLMDMAKGKEVAASELSHSYPGSELNEITTVLKSLFKIQEVILKVNQEYIRSAAMDDKYREEPPFKLQGSYRNMNKMAEKVVAIMNDSELQELINDHYIGEAQLLTTGAEENLLKLKELRATLTEKEQIRWHEIKTEFKIRNSLAGDDSDGATKIASQLSNLKESLTLLTQSFTNEFKAHNTLAEDDINGNIKIADQISNLRDSLTSFTQSVSDDRALTEKASKEQLESVTQAIGKLNLDVSVINEPLPGLDDAMSSLSKTLETAFVPVIVAMNKKLDINMEVLEEVTNLSKNIKKLSLLKTTQSTTRGSSRFKNPIKDKTTKKVTKKTAKKVTKKTTKKT